jgi:hypothetical protein
MLPKEQKKNFECREGLTIWPALRYNQSRKAIGKTILVPKGILRHWNGERRVSAAAAIQKMNS